MKSARFLQGWKSRFFLWGVVFAAAAFAVLFSAAQPQSADAATTLPTKMNFQGKLTNSAGNIYANGTYNMRFRIYNAATVGAVQWNEDRLVSAGQGVTVTNGQFSVQLGTVSSLPASIFASNSLYFEVELPTPASATSSSPVWTENPMTPRNQLATSAYAYNAETLDGIDSAAFAQMGTANAFTAANSITVANANAFQVKNGSTNIFNVDTSASQIAIGTSDTTGALLVLDTKTSAGDPTGSNGGMYYNSNTNKFRCYETSAWKDCITTPSLQTAYDNDTSGVADVVTSSAAKTFLFKAGTGFDSSSLFDIQNAAGTNLFVVDSSASRIYIGEPIADGTGTVLVLDTKNTSGDPAGVDGAMYYNSALAKFRCYEGGAWMDCSTGETLIMKTADQAATVSSTTMQNVTDMSFSIGVNETYAFKMIVPINVSNINSDAKYTVTIPTGAVIAAQGEAPLTTTTTSPCGIQASASACTIAVNATFRSLVTISGVITNSTTAGTVNLQFAQNTSNATAGPSVLKGATLVYNKL